MARQTVQLPKKLLQRIGWYRKAREKLQKELPKKVDNHRTALQKMYVKLDQQQRLHLFKTDYDMYKDIVVVEEMYPGEVETIFKIDSNMVIFVIYRESKRLGKGFVSYVQENLQQLRKSLQFNIIDAWENETTQKIIKAFEKEISNLSKAFRGTVSDIFQWVADMIHPDDKKSQKTTVRNSFGRWSKLNWLEL